VGAWTNYGSAISLQLNDKIEAMNFTLEATSYYDSPLVSATYAPLITTLPNPLITPVGGGFSGATFPTVVTIDDNVVPSADSEMKYKVLRADGTTKTNWTQYNGAITIAYGETVMAQNLSKNTDYFANSDITQETYLLSEVLKLPPPVLTETTTAGKKYVTIALDTSTGFTYPAGSYIQYALKGLDPGVRSDDTPNTGSKYGTPIAVATNVTEFVVTARAYPPKSLNTAYDSSDPADIDIDFPSAAPSLTGARLDVDTSHLIYPFNQGKSDKHAHFYNENNGKNDTAGYTGVDMMNMMQGLRSIQAQIPAGVRFKIIVANAGLSPAAKVVINKTFNPADATSYMSASTYDDLALAGLPIYSTNGITGTTKLTQLLVYYDIAGVESGGALGSTTGFVKGNKPGKLGEWRNGALTIQAVLVKSDGTPGYTTNPAYSNGGVQGVATSGLLWECTIFHHGNSGPYQ